MLAVFVGVRAEQEAINKRLELLHREETPDGYIICEGSYRDRPVLSCRTSIGEERVTGIIDRVLDSHPVSAVISARVASGVPGDFEIGQLAFCPKTFLYRAGDEHMTTPTGESDLRLLELAGKAATSAGIPHLVGDCLTFSPVTATPVNRGALSRWPDIAVADTDGYFVAEAAFKRGLPFLSVRASLASAWDSIPESISMLSKRGDVTAWTEVTRNLAHPQQLPSYLKLREAVIECS
jgi:hypothetical protein